MAFLLANWGRASVSANEPIYTLANSVVVGAPRIYTYYTADTQATVSAANYFNAVVNDLAVGDIIQVYSSSDVSLITYLVSALNAATPSISLILSTGAQVAQGTITNAQMLAGLYAVPVQLIPAPGANRMIVVDNATLSIVYVAPQFQNGGAVIFQYGSTVHGAGVNSLATTVAAADINGATAGNTQLLLGAAQAWGLNTTWANLGIYLSCATGEFTAGGGSLRYSISYRVASLV